MLDENGISLARSYWVQMVRPLLDLELPSVPRIAARIGSGSDVLGLDDEMSRDHDWGLRLQLLVPSVRNADRILHELADTGYALERVRLVCSRFGRESGYLEREDVEATLKRQIEFLVPDEWKTSAAAVNMGAPLLTIGPRTKLRQAYREIAEALARSGQGFKPVSSETSPDASRKGLFSFFAGSK